MDKDIELWHVDELLGELRRLARWVDDLTAVADEMDNDKKADSMHKLIKALRARFMYLFAELDNRLTSGEAPPAEWRAILDPR